MNHLSLPKLILLAALDPIIHSINTGAEKKFPIKIGDFNFVKTWDKARGTEMFSFAVYENDNGIKAFAKMWSGRVKDFNYFTLLNEKAVFEVLNSAHTRLHNKLPRGLRDVKAPKMFIESRGNCYHVILTEFIENGKIASAMNSKKKFNIYRNCLRYLRFLSDHLTEEEKGKITKRSSGNILTIYPLLLLKSLYLRPHLRKELLKTVPYVLGAATALLRRNNLEFSHRDLHLDNILVVGRKTYPLDMQFCLLSEEIYDMLTTLRSHWGDREFRQKLTLEMARMFGADKEYEKVLRGLMFISSVHGLSGNNLTEEAAKRNERFLKDVVNLNDEDRQSGHLNRSIVLAK